MEAFETAAIGRCEEWLVELALEAGLNLAGLTHEVTNYFKNHAIKRHGNAGTEKARGQLAVSPADFDKIAEIIKDPDCVIANIRRNEEIMIVYSKKFGDATIIYYEEVLDSKRNKALRSKTIYKKAGVVKPDTFLKIVKNSANTDMSEAKMAVGVGGNPDGEAKQFARWKPRPPDPPDPT